MRPLATCSTGVGENHKAPGLAAARGRTIGRAAGQRRTWRLIKRRIRSRLLLLLTNQARRGRLGGCRGRGACTCRRRGSWSCGTFAELPLQTLVGRVLCEYSSQWVRPDVRCFRVVQHKVQVARCGSVDRFVQLRTDRPVWLQALLILRVNSGQSKASAPAPAAQNYRASASLLSGIRGTERKERLVAKIQVDSGLRTDRFMLRRRRDTPLLLILVQ